MGPVIVVGLVVDEDRPILVIPEHEVPVAGVGGVETHQMGVDSLPVEGRLHCVPDRVVPHMRGQSCRNPEPRQPHRGVRRVPTGLNRVGIVEGNLASVGEVQPMPVLVVPGPDVRVRQSDEDVRRRIADAEHLVVGHLSMRPETPGGPLGTYRPRSRDFRPRVPQSGADVDASACSGSHSGASGSAPLDRTAAGSWSCEAGSLGDVPDSQSKSRRRPRRPAAAASSGRARGSAT